MMRGMGIIDNQFFWMCRQGLDKKAARVNPRFDSRKRFLD